MAQPTARVLEILDHTGLLLKQDKELPNVVSLLTGESLRGSWWSHPKAGLVFEVLSELSDHPDVLFTKLLLRKVTLVHRRLWPALLAVASSNEPWQLHGLSEQASKLLADVLESKAAIRFGGPASKELEMRLLVHAENVHTESGLHATSLERWSVWRWRVGIKPLRSAKLGRRFLEETTIAMGAAPSALPWSSGKSEAT